MSHTTFAPVLEAAFRGIYEAAGVEPFGSVAEGEAFILQRMSIYQMGYRRGFRSDEIREIESVVFDELFDLMRH